MCTKSVFVAWKSCAEWPEPSLVARQWQVLQQFKPPWTAILRPLASTCYVIHIVCFLKFGDPPIIGIAWICYQTWHLWDLFGSFEAPEFSETSTPMKSSQVLALIESPKLHTQTAGGHHLCGRLSIILKQTTKHVAPQNWKDHDYHRLLQTTKASEANMHLVTSASFRAPRTSSDTFFSDCWGVEHLGSSIVALSPG